MIEQSPTRAGPRHRGHIRKARDTFSAYLRIDIIEDKSFPIGTGMKYIAVLVPVFLYFFQADYLGARDQYASTLIGVAVAAGLADALVGFTGRLMFAQERGTLETYLVEPVSWTFIPIAMNVWRSICGMAVTMLMLFAGVLLGADLELAKVPLFVGILFLGVLACNAVGVFAASFLVLFKRGEPVIALYALAAALLGGTLFPISVLPGWLRWMSYVIPNTYVISASRSVLLENPPAGMSAEVAVLALAAFTVVALVVGLKLFGAALQYAWRTGVLST